MNKTFVATAALALAGAASAQSSVTLFGVVDMAVSHVSGTVADRSGLGGGALNANRLGFRGVEDLGGGLKAGFWLEIGIEPDSGQGRDNTSVDNLSNPAAGGLQFGRRATLSLLGSFGELRVGRDFTPTYHNESQFVAFTRNGIAATVITQSNLIGQTRSRTSNGIQYLLPSGLGGLYGELQFAFGEQASNAGTPAGNTEDDGQYVGARIGYRNGPLDLALSAGNTTVTRNAGQSNDRSVVNLGASYDFKAVKVFGLYSRQTIDNSVGGGFQAVASNAPANALAGVDTEGKAYAVGVTIPAGSGVFKIAYSQIDVENGHGPGTEPSAGKWALGYQHNLSRRTALYANISRLKNKDAGPGVSDRNLTAGTGRLLGVADATTGRNGGSTGFEVGVRHSF